MLFSEQAVFFLLPLLCMATELTVKSEEPYSRENIERVSFPARSTENVCVKINIKN